MLGPQRMWVALAALAAVLIGWRSLPTAPNADHEPMALLDVIENGQGHIEKVSRADCVRQDGHVWIEQADGFECMSFVVGGAATAADVAVVFLDGDVPDSMMAQASQSSARAREQEFANTLSQRLEVPIVIIGRPGLMGSTGFHLNGGRSHEAAVIDATIPAVKQKLGFRRLALAGQSGGARLIAQVMVLGHQNIACAAMGSGAYGTPRLVGGGTAGADIFGNPGSGFLVPEREVARVPTEPQRRSYVIGDPTDTRAPFPEQRAWAEALAAAGHHARLIVGHGRGDEHHGMAAQALTAAALCARGRSDADITAAVQAL